MIKKLDPQCERFGVNLLSKVNELVGAVNRLTDEDRKDDGWTYFGWDVHDYRVHVRGGVVSLQSRRLVSGRYVWERVEPKALNLVKVMINALEKADE